MTFIKYHIFLISSICLLSSCFSLTSLDEANTVGKNNLDLSFKADVLVLDRAAGDQSSPIALPMIAEAAYGVSENTDIGIKCSNLGTIGLTLKQKIGSLGKIDFGLKPAISARFDIIPNWFAPSDNYFTLSPHVDVLTTYKVNENLRILINAKYSYFQQWENGLVQNSFYHDSYTVGASFFQGNKVKIGVSYEGLMHDPIYSQGLLIDHILFSVGASLEIEKPIKTIRAIFN